MQVQASQLTACPRLLPQVHAASGEMQINGKMNTTKNTNEIQIHLQIQIQNTNRGVVRRKGESEEGHSSLHSAQLPLPVVPSSTTHPVETNVNLTMHTAKSNSWH